MLCIPCLSPGNIFPWYRRSPAHFPRREIRLPMLIEWRGHAEDKGVHLRDTGLVGTKCPLGAGRLEEAGIYMPMYARSALRAVIFFSSLSKSYTGVAPIDRTAPRLSVNGRIPWATSFAALCLGRQSKVSALQRRFHRKVMPGPSLERVLNNLYLFFSARMLSYNSVYAFACLRRLNSSSARFLQCRRTGFAALFCSRAQTKPSHRPPTSPAPAR